jgi:hypothetical protein
LAIYILLGNREVCREAIGWLQRVVVLGFLSVVSRFSEFESDLVGGPLEFAGATRKFSHVSTEMYELRDSRSIARN